MSTPLFVTRRWSMFTEIMAKTIDDLISIEPNRIYGDEINEFHHSAIQGLFELIFEGKHSEERSEAKLVYDLAMEVVRFQNPRLTDEDACFDKIQALSRFHDTLHVSGVVVNFRNQARELSGFLQKFTKLFNEQELRYNPPKQEEKPPTQIYWPGGYDMETPRPPAFIET